MSNRLDDINAALAQAKQHGVFPSAERADTDMRWLVAEVAAARKVLETAIELPGYCAYAVIGVDAAAWRAWQALAAKEQA